MLALALALALRHGGSPPPFNNPDVPGPCYTLEHDELRGTSQLHYGEGYDGGWAAYVVLNGTAVQPTSCNGFLSDYESAGTVGAGFQLTLRANPFHALPPGAVGFVAWSFDWVEPYWTGAGWSMLGDVDLWWTLSKPLVINGEQIGWTLTGKWPDDPALAGVRAFYQGLVAWPDASDAAGVDARLSGTWVVWFTP